MHVCVVRWDASDLLSGMRLVVLGEQRDGLPRLASPTGSADPVNVVFDGTWELQTSTISTSKNNISTSGRGDACTHGTVDNQLDLRDIQAARRDISGDENGRLAPRSFASRAEAEEWALPEEQVVEWNYVCGCDA